MIATPAAAFADPDNANGDVQSDLHSSAQSNQHRTDGTTGISGVVDEPQPASNADLNGTGANTFPDPPYRSTREGLASENGNGEGNATGRPCAACVGKADNKNPPGQLPFPDDNNGYECDGNSGIAKTNPAHTSCTPTSGEVLDNTVVRQSAVLGETVVRPTTVLGATLARTGFDSVNLVMFAGLMAAGGAFILVSRRRSERHRI